MKETIICPKCHSDQLSANQKGFDGNQATIGMLTGGALAGVALGMHDSGKIQITCLKCGNKFVPGGGAVKTVDDAGNQSIDYMEPPVDTNRRNSFIVAFILIAVLLVLAIILMNNPFAFL